MLKQSVFDGELNRIGKLLSSMSSETNRPKHNLDAMLDTFNMYTDKSGHAVGSVNSGGCCTPDGICKCISKIDEVHRIIQGF